jgi:alpha-galactosidase
MNHRIQTIITLIIFCLTTSIAGQSVSKDTVWLTSLDLKKMHQGWGNAKKDSSVTGHSLSIAGVVFPRGVGTHAPSSLWIDLKGKADRFQSYIGLDDSSKNGRGSVEFKVLGDGKKLFESNVMHLNDIPVFVDLNIKGVKKLVLFVGDAGDGIGYDHADWAEARFLSSGGHPVATDRPSEQKVVLTPKPSAKPRINGPSIFGVRPGSPFMYKIPATGVKPLAYTVENLPSGLSVDRSTGIISGVIGIRGHYPVTLTVSNPKGKAKRNFMIVCGDTIALTPHMGWNSWYVWENHVTDKHVRDAADAMVKSGLIDHGYMYVNIDDCWGIREDSKDSTNHGEPRDAHGKVNSNKRFPDMKALTDYLHSRGLKAGIYTSPGKTTCAGHTGAYGYEELDIQRFVEWGFDFLKYDWCSYGDLADESLVGELKRPYSLISSIIRKQPRDIVLNLCQYGMGKVWQWGREVGGNSWRTAGDLGGSFEGIGNALFRDGFDLYAREHLEQYGGPGAWNDPDYLLLGYISDWKGGTAPTPLTPNEQYSHVSLWCLLAAPLIFSGDMTRLDDFTLNLLINDEILDVDQDALGLPGYRVSKEGDNEVWVRKLEDGSVAVGLFNRGEFGSKIVAKWGDLGLNGPQRVRDLWRQKDLGMFDNEFNDDVGRHGVTMIRIWPGNR